MDATKQTIEQILSSLHVDGIKRSVLGKYALMKFLPRPFFRCRFIDLFIFEKNFDDFFNIVQNEFRSKHERYKIVNTFLSKVFVKVLTWNKDDPTLVIHWSPISLLARTAKFNMSCCQFSYFKKNNVFVSEPLHNSFALMALQKYTVCFIFPDDDQQEIDDLVSTFDSIGFTISFVTIES